MIFRLLVALALLAHPGRTDAQPVPSALFDVHQSPAAGSALVDLVGTLVGRAEDRVLKPRLFEEETRLRRSAGVAYRFVKLFGLDLPQEEWLRVANHEVFGHGARVRERFDAAIDYTVGVPPPYGGGGGSTSIRFDREPTVEEVLAITVGGMEANNVAASRIALRAIARGTAPHRDLLRYVLGRLDTVGYILDTGDDPESEGHDVSDFVITLRDVTGSNVTPRSLRRRALIGLADPVLGYAVYGLAVSYLWRGDADARIPAFRIGQARYVPALRFQLAPFGTEWVMDNTFAGAMPVTRVSLRLGGAPGAGSFGASVYREAVWISRRARIDADLHAWRQPRVRDDGEMPRATGAAAYATLSSPIEAKWLRWAVLVVHGGYKTRGFVEGEPLGAGFVLRGGLGLR
jgi:hypothetical protein